MSDPATNTAGMSDVRSSYLETARQVADLVADERVAARWNEAGALEGMTVVGDGEVVAPGSSLKAARVPSVEA